MPTTPEERLKILSEYVWELAHRNPDTRVYLHSLLYDLTVIESGNPKQWIKEKSLKQRALELP